MPWHSINSQTRFPRGILQKHYVPHSSFNLLLITLFRHVWSQLISRLLDKSSNSIFSRTKTRIKKFYSAFFPYFSFLFFNKESSPARGMLYILFRQNKTNDAFLQWTDSNVLDKFSNTISPKTRASMKKISFKLLFETISVVYCTFSSDNNFAS